MDKARESFFSISFSLIPINQVMPFSLYVNSSSLEKHEHFVKVFSKHETLTMTDVEYFKTKYLQIYILESERSAYLKFIVESSSSSIIEKTAIIKESAITHLKSLFDASKNYKTDFLQDAIINAKETVTYLIDTVSGKSVREIQELLANLSFHDFYTYDHSVNVSMYSISILRSLRPTASKREMLTMGMGALLHDLGKTKIPTEIINSTGKLSDEDFNLIRTHPAMGEDLFLNHPVNVPDLDLEIIRRIILEHHENIDGTGYPNKLKGEQIHFYARICAIADFFDAITTKRSYAPVLTMDDAVIVMAKTVGKKIDQRIFNVFLHHVKKLIMGDGYELELEDDFEPSIPHLLFPFKKKSPHRIPLGIGQGKQKKP